MPTAIFARTWVVASVQSKIEAASQALWWLTRSGPTQDAATIRTAGLLQNYGDEIPREKGTTPRSDTATLGRYLDHQIEPDGLQLLQLAPAMTKASIVGRGTIHTYHTVSWPCGSSAFNSRSEIPPCPFMLECTAGSQRIVSGPLAVCRGPSEAGRRSCHRMHVLLPLISRHGQRMKIDKQSVELGRRSFGHIRFAD